jgi:hypothetical protein
VNWYQIRPSLFYRFLVLFLFLLILLTSCGPNVEKGIVGTWQYCLNHPDYQGIEVFGSGYPFEHIFKFYEDGTFLVQHDDYAVSGQYTVLSQERVEFNYATGDLLFESNELFGTDAIVYYEFSKQDADHLTLMELYDNTQLMDDSMYWMCRVNGKY